MARLDPGDSLNDDHSHTVPYDPIPALDVDDPVVDLGKNPDGCLQVPDWNDAGWRDRGPEPGQRGPCRHRRPRRLLATAASC